MAQHVRGDVTFEIDGEEYTVTPVFKAVAAIEAATGMGLIEAMQAVASVKVGVCATVLFQALRAEGETVSYDKVGQAVVASLAEPEQPLIKAAVEYLNAFFPKKQAEGKKTKAKAAVTG